MDHRHKHKKSNMKLSEQNVEYLSNLGEGKHDLVRTPKTLIIKEKNGKLIFVKIKILCLSKYSIKKMNRQATDQKKYL